MMALMERTFAEVEAALAEPRSKLLMPRSADILNAGPGREFWLGSVLSVIER